MVVITVAVVVVSLGDVVVGIGMVIEGIADVSCSMGTLTTEITSVSLLGFAVSFPSGLSSISRSP